MINIFTREIKALFRNLTSVACMALFLMASALLFITNDLTTGYSAIQPVFTNMSLVAAITVPPVAIFAIGRERKAGNFELLEALPVTKGRLVLAKFFAVFVFFMIPTAVMAIYPIILAILGAQSVIQGYVVFVPFVLCIAFFVAMSFMIGVIFERTWVALAVNYTVHIVLFTLGLIAVLFGGAVEYALRWISPFRRFDPIVFDILDISSVLFYISLCALFVFVTVKLISSKKERSLVQSIAVFSVCALALNIGVSFLPARFTELDVSADNIYSTSDATSEFLGGLKEDVTVYLIDPDNDVKLETYIRHYCEQSDRIKLVEIDSEKDTEFLKKYGITGSALNYSMVVDSGKRWKFVDSSECFSYYYYGENDYVQPGFMSVAEYLSCGSYYTQMLTFYQEQGANAEMLNTIYQTVESLARESIYCINPELALTPAIEYVTREHVPTVYFVSNHAEKNTAANPLDISKLSDMPADASFIIINNPDTDYTESEIAALLRFSDRGGRLLLLTDKNDTSLVNLSKLMTAFGLSASEEVVSIDGKTDIEATVNATGTFLEGSGLDKIKLTEANVINVSEGTDYDILPLLSVELKGDTEEDAKKSAPLAVAATKNGAPRLVWVTAADTFANKDTEKMSDEEVAEYTKALYLTRSATQWLRVVFSSNLAENFNAPVPYSAQIISISSGVSVFVGCMLVGLAPIMLFSMAFLNIRIRKKRSAQALAET